MKKAVFFIAALLMLEVAPAFAATITFDDSVGYVDSYTEAGFVFTQRDDAPVPGALDISGGQLRNCGANYSSLTDGGPDCRGGGVTLTHQSTSFALHSFDATFGDYGIGSPTFLVVYGVIQGSEQTLHEKFELTGAMQTFNLSGAWSNLSSVEFSTLDQPYSCAEYESYDEDYGYPIGPCVETRPWGEYGYADDPVLDNVVVSTVPVPAAAWLLGSALISGCWVGRRKRIS